MQYNKSTNKNKVIFHIDFNSYFATVEQQANPRLRGKPIGVTGGDRMKRTVIGAASVEAKKYGVKTGMQIWEAKKLCPDLILVAGDSDKYLETTKRFLNILKDVSPYVEVFSIDEVFLEIPCESSWSETKLSDRILASRDSISTACQSAYSLLISPSDFQNDMVRIAENIKSRIKSEIGEWITCSIGISYNKRMAKLAGSLQKPDGLVIIEDEEAAMFILDRIELDEICGIGFRIKNRLNSMGVYSFSDLRKVPLAALLASFKSYGQILYNMARGIDESLVNPFYEKEEVKSIGHRHTIDHDTSDLEEIKQILLKLTELIARRLRAKKLVGKTVSCYFRYATLNRHPELDSGSQKKMPKQVRHDGGFEGMGMQLTIPLSDDGLEIFKASWKAFHSMWSGDRIRMVGISISNLRLKIPQTLSLLPETNRQERIIKALDQINNKYGEFTLQRGILLGTVKFRRMANSFLSDRRFKL